MRPYNLFETKLREWRGTAGNDPMAVSIPIPRGKYRAIELDAQSEVPSIQLMLDGLHAPRIRLEIGDCLRTDFETALVAPSMPVPTSGLIPINAASTTLLEEEVDAKWVSLGVVSTGELGGIVRLRLWHIDPGVQPAVCRWFTCQRRFRMTQVAGAGGTQLLGRLNCDGQLNSMVSLGVANPGIGMAATVNVFSEKRREALSRIAAPVQSGVALLSVNSAPPGTVENFGQIAIPNGTDSLAFDVVVPAAAGVTPYEITLAMSGCIRGR